MKLSLYLRDKLWFILGQLVITGFFAVVLLSLKASLWLTMLLSFSILLITFLILLPDYFARKIYYDKILNTLDSMEKKQYIFPLIPEPSFSDAKVLWEILRQTTKAMNDEIACYQILSEEYREYIETWIHEVKTPISAISLMCENNRNLITNNILDENRKIEEYVEQALFYARSTNLEKDYSIRCVKIESLVKNTVKKYSKQLIAKRAKIHIEDIHENVYSDPKWVEFILGQIISNSIKYSRENLIFTFIIQKMESGIRLVIEDNGIGIQPQDLGRVFQKGFTGNNGRKFTHSTGIGLYLCKQLCEKMNLNIEIESEVNIGTKIFILFPTDKFILLS